MAPEILAAQDAQGDCGYSFAADVWALGVIMYTLVVGRPSFETSVVEDTYKKIKDVSYRFPEQRVPPLSFEFEDMITMILQKDPFMRPSLEQIESHNFFTDTATPL